jgi:hypothetical protein
MHSGSSGSVVSGYWLDDRAIEVWSPTAVRAFSLTSVSRPALGPIQPPVQWVPGVLSPRIKRGRDVTLTTHPHLVPRSRMSRSYTSSPPWASIGVLWDCFTLHTLWPSELRALCKTSRCFDTVCIDWVASDLIGSVLDKYTDLILLIWSVWPSFMFLFWWECSTSL